MYLSVVDFHLIEIYNIPFFVDDDDDIEDEEPQAVPIIPILSVDDEADFAAVAQIEEMLTLLLDNFNDISHMRCFEHTLQVRIFL